MTGTVFEITPVLAAGRSNAALFTFFIYTLAVFGLAAISNRLMKKKSFLSEYFLGSRSLGVWAFALTFAATSASGGSFTGFPSRIYTHGWILGLWIGSYVVVPICAMGLLGKRINHMARKSGAITVPDVLRDRFGSPMFALLAVSLIVFFMSFNLVAQFKAGSMILQTLLQGVELFETTAVQLSNITGSFTIFSGIDPQYLLCLFAFSIAVIFYTTYGGFHAVVWTDVMQGIVMVFGVLLMLPLALYQVGGLPKATQQIAKMTPPRLGLARFELEVPLAEDFSISSPWFTLPGEDEDHPRLFRVNGTVVFKTDETVARNIKVVELTTPFEIEKQLSRLSNKNANNVNSLNETLRKLKERQIEWIEQNRDSTIVNNLEQTLRDLRSDLTRIDNNSVEVLNPEGLENAKVILTLISDYRYGANKPGVYVTGPGPDPPSLPEDPVTVLIIVNQPDVKIRLLDEEKHVVAEKLVSEERVSYFSVENHHVYRVEIVKDGFEEFSQEVKVDSDASDEDIVIEANLISSPGKTHQSSDSVEETYSHSSGFLPLSLAVSFFFMWAISGAGQPSSMVRLMAFNSSLTLRRSIFTVAIYYSMIYFPLVIIFCCARILIPGMEAETDRIMPAMAVFLTENAGVGWLAGLLVAAPFAAVMSTVDSFLLMISSALVRDIYQRNFNPKAREKTLRKLSYLFTLLVGTGAMLGAVNPPQFLQDIIVYTGSGLAACFLAPMVFALYSPRANVQGCMAGMLTGFAAHIAMYVSGIFVNGSFFKPYKLLNFDPIIVGLFVSFLANYVVTKIGPPPSQELVRKYFYKNSGN